MDFLGFPYEVAQRFWHLALAAYLETDDKEAIKALEDKAKIVGYTRLLRRSMRRQEPNREALIANYKQHLEELLPQVDTLEF